jgi:hypothetical protein
MSFVTKINQSTQAFFNPKDYIPASAAVTTPGTAHRHIFLPAHSHAAVSAVAALNINFRHIKKH